MNKINLNEIGLSEQYPQEALNYGDQLHVARVAVQHKELYKVITEKGEIRAEVAGKLSYAATRCGLSGRWRLGLGGPD